MQPLLQLNDGNIVAQGNVIVADGLS